MDAPLMTETSMTALAGTLHLAPAAGVVLGLAVGAILGLIHFGSLRWNTRLYLAGGSIALAFALQLARFAILAGAFILLARLGALPLLSGALGLLAARSYVVRRVESAP
jgi:F1F0 ATPase subunit 2